MNPKSSVLGGGKVSCKCMDTVSHYFGCSETFPLLNNYATRNSGYQISNVILLWVFKYSHIMIFSMHKF